MTARRWSLALFATSVLLVGFVVLAAASLEEQRELLEDICDERARWERETVAERQPTRETDRRLSELVDRWQRCFPDSRLFDCEAGGYCYSLCPAIQHPGRAGFPPLVDAERAHCAPALAPSDPCATFRKQACADGSYLCAQAGVLADHARCHLKDDLLAVLARESCGGYLATWKGETLPAKPYVSTAGDPAWCKMFENPPPECGGAADLPHDNGYEYMDTPCCATSGCGFLRQSIYRVSMGRYWVSAQRWIDRCEPWINELPDRPSWWQSLRLNDITADEFTDYRRALRRLRESSR